MGDRLSFGARFFAGMTAGGDGIHIAIVQIEEFGKPAVYSVLSLWVKVIIFGHLTGGAHCV